MPKGAVHHVHDSAANPLNILVALTHEDIVYYGEKDNLFKVVTDGNIPEGYLKCNDMRKQNPDIDIEFKANIMLGQKEIECQESEIIWQNFQPKFMLTYEIANYVEFYKRLIVSVIQQFIDEKIYIVEIRHIPEFMFGDDHKPVGILKEMEILNEVNQQFKKQYPHFELKVILSSLKLIGKGHVELILNDTITAMKEYPGLIAGYDMVNEEDTTPQIIDFINELLKGREQNPDFPFMLHAGESNKRGNKNLYDAVLLGSKRIGHAFGIEMHPLLEDICRKKEICLECCPLSNYILGYQLDLRNHPARFLFNRGVPISISPDDPSFWDYEGVTLDYAWITIAWELGLKELKRLALNGIKYSTVNEEAKKANYSVFDTEWATFIKNL